MPSTPNVQFERARVKEIGGQSDSTKRLTEDRRQVLVWCAHIAKLDMFKGWT